MFPEAKRAVGKKFRAIKQFKMFEIQMAPRAAREMFYYNVLNILRSIRVYLQDYFRFSKWRPRKKFKQKLQRESCYDLKIVV